MKETTGSKSNCSSVHKEHIQFLHGTKWSGYGSALRIDHYYSVFTIQEEDEMIHCVWNTRGFWYH